MSVCPLTGTVYLHDVYAKQSSNVYPVQQDLTYDLNGLQYSIVYYEGVTPQIIIDSPLLAAAEPEIFSTGEAPVPLSPPQEVMCGPDFYSMPQTFDSYQSCDGVEQRNNWISSNVPHTDLGTARADDSYGQTPVPYVEPELYPAHFPCLDTHPSPKTYGYADNVQAFPASVEPPFDVESTVVGSQYLPIKKVKPWERVGECRWDKCGKTVKANESDMLKHLKEFHHPDLRKLGPDSRVKCLWDGCKRTRAFPMNMGRHCASSRNHLIDQCLCDFCKNATYSSLDGFYRHLSVCSSNPFLTRRSKVRSRKSYMNPELAQRSPTFMMVQQNRAMNTVEQSL
ncbi:hypothetical protein M378DRAFT_27065 [Amanita muscaria Koide BX008]|uniref:C2H2-type domain-containing protein n=1 Tax=Amanita muscaria (strain Koide BX008) TaxID=946122 RepID=A0A0C2SYQ9_AMAMK|nr:hypothetical protein M378DRAFT_27065 [Amanita muscaria Koide BX008]